MSVNVIVLTNYLYDFRVKGTKKLLILKYRFHIHASMLSPKPYNFIEMDLEFNIT